MQMTSNHPTDSVSRTSFLKDVMTSVGRDDRYTDLLPNLRTHPIPYFGNPAHAVVATIGRNPSATEFSFFQSTRWSRPELTPQELDQVLCRYFTDPASPPHPWFDTWTYCLKRLGHSYKKDTVHLDLSPRATRMKRNASPELKLLFANMIVEDLRWFFDALKLCPYVRVILMAGIVTDVSYIGEFLHDHAPDGYSFQQRSSLGKTPSGPKFYDLSGPDLPVRRVFFFGSGPSARDRGVELRKQFHIAVNIDALKSEGFADKAQDDTTSNSSTDNT
jgi:hypothetical protein